MPEGDSVLQLWQRLQFLVGKTVTRTSIRTPRFANRDFPVPSARRSGRTESICSCFSTNRSWPPT